MGFIFCKQYDKDFKGDKKMASENPKFIEEMEKLKKKISPKDNSIIKLYFLLFFCNLLTERRSKIKKRGLSNE